MRLTISKTIVIIMILISSFGGSAYGIELIEETMLIEGDTDVETVQVITGKIREHMLMKACDEVGKISVDPNSEEIIQNKFDNIGNSQNDLYLCFELTTLPQENFEAIQLKKSLNLNIVSGNKVDIYITGLELGKDSTFIEKAPLLKITNSGAGNLYLLDSTFTGGGIEIADGGEDAGMVSILDSTIDCQGNGHGIRITADGTEVAGSEISGCTDGIRIEASDTMIGASSPENYEQYKNKIHNNETGIHVVSGERNRFV